MGAKESPVISVRTRLGAYSGRPFYCLKDCVIQGARSEDMSALANLERVLFPTETYGNDVLSQKKFTYFLTRANAAVLTLNYRGNIIGYMLVLFRSYSGTARLYSIGLSPQYQGKGFGRFMLNTLDKFCANLKVDKILMETHEKNAAMQKLIEASGYEKLRTLTEYYADKSAAFKYAKILQNKDKRQ